MSSSASCMPPAQVRLFQTVGDARCNPNRTDFVTVPCDWRKRKLQLTSPVRLRDKPRMIELILACVLTELPNLESFPGVESAKVAVKCDDPRLTIVHIRDWHFIEFAEFRADVQDEIAEDQIQNQYLIFAREVQEVQDQQELFLEAMAKAGHQDVWIEGLIPEFERAFIHICHAAARNGLYESPNPISVGAAAPPVCETANPSSRFGHRQRSETHKATGRCRQAAHSF